MKRILLERRKDALPDKMMYAVSACLIGENCKYSGGNNLHKALCSFLKDKQWIAVCPEVLGGLSIPRECCEIVEQKVISQSGRDCTREYVEGAHKALQQIQDANAQVVITQPRSPSCGCDKIYDGSFQGHLINGNGVFVQLCHQAGIKVVNVDDFLRKEVKRL